jgi:diaminopimelate decarboxylase
MLKAVAIEKDSDQNQLNNWWERVDLNYEDGSLSFANKVVKDISNFEGPTYIYSKARLKANLKRLHQALEDVNIQHQIHYAVKANRHPAILKTVKDTGYAGVDACSPKELELAIASGFKQNQINYTGTSISNRDYQLIANYTSIQFNADSLSVIKQIGERNLFGRIGIRINPQIGLGYNEDLEYAGNGVSKFGIYPDQIKTAFDLAADYGIIIDTIHFHAGSGYLTAQLDAFELLLKTIRPIIDQYKIKHLNIGGGLGVMQSEGDTGLDLERWAKILKAQVGDLKIILEPGDYIVKDAGILVGEVTYIEEKAGVQFLGLNLGMNINYEYAYYQMNLEPVPLNQSNGPLEKYTIAGNINEPIDLMGEGILLPKMEEGDLIAFLNTGGYGASTASNHCMRGDFEEIVID